MENDNHPIVLPKSMYEMIEENVTKLYIELNVSIPIDPFCIVKKLGYILRYYSEIAESNDDELILRISEDGKKRDGLSFFDPQRETFVICLNDIDTWYRQHNAFTIMHEIGHIRMNHKSDSRLAEAIANYYAAYSLVPSPLTYEKGCSSCEDLLSVFGVSRECAKKCWKRSENWRKYHNTLKDYETLLIDYNRRKEGNAYDCK